MYTPRRLAGLGLTFVLFVACVVLTSHSLTSAEDSKPGKKHVTLTRALKDLKGSRAELKKLEGDYAGHRAKAIKHIDSAVEELEKAIKSAEKK